MGPIGWAVAKQQVDLAGSRLRNRGKTRSGGGSLLRGTRSWSGAGRTVRYVQRCVKRRKGKYLTSEKHIYTPAKGSGGAV